MDADPRGPATRLLDSARLASASVLDLARTRVELFGHEAGLELTRARATIALLVCALICFSLALVLLVLLIVVMFWDSHRLLAIGGCGGVLLIASAILLWRSRQRISAEPRPFAATLGELAKDCASLRGGAP